jgi:hypothetical protein
VKKLIITFIDELKSNEKLVTFDEASTKQAIVMRLLSFVGWDIFNVDEVVPDFSVKEKQVDYALKVKDQNKVFILTKKPGDELEGFQRELIDFSLLEKVDISVLTNGIVWWFYLPSAEGDDKHMNFCNIDFLQDDPDDIALKLKDFIGKSSVSSKNAVTAAKAILEARKQKIANEFIPEAWNVILTGPNRIIAELISEKSEELCGYRPEQEFVDKFLEDHMGNWIIKPKPADKSNNQAAKASVSEQEAPDVSSKKTKPKNYTGESISSFSFNGNTYKVGSWDAMLMTLCDIIVAAHKEDFDKVLWLSGQNRSYFSNIESELRRPEKIKKTGIFIETNLNPNETVNTALNIISAFGYSSKDLVITTEQ